MAAVPIETLIQVRGGSLPDAWSIKKRELAPIDPAFQSHGGEPRFLKLSGGSYGLRQFILGSAKESLAGYQWIEELKNMRNELQNPATAISCVFGSSAKKKKKRRSSEEDAEAKDPWLPLELPRVEYSGEGAGPICMKVLRSSIKKSAPRCGAHRMQLGVH